MEKTIERFQFVFLVAFFVSGIVTVNAVSNLPYTSLDTIPQDVSPYFIALSQQFPEQFEK
ncbi:hypothetical protein KFU94_66165 [Chloroflexi bacterium TSY]|nr:hypothetical protein [Chloroflexi bacterium TSY]